MLAECLHESLLALYNTTTPEGGLNRCKHEENQSDTFRMSGNDHTLISIAGGSISESAGMRGCQRVCLVFVAKYSVLSEKVSQYDHIIDWSYSNLAY